EELEEQASVKNSSKETNKDSQRQGDGETANRTTGVQEVPAQRVKQNKSDGQRCQVGILNTAPGSSKPQTHRFFLWLTCSQLFFNALKGKNVGIHRHTNRQQQPSDTRQS